MLRTFSNLLPFTYQQKLYRGFSIVLLYHNVYDNQIVKHVDNLYTMKSFNIFKQNVEFMLKTHKPIDIQGVKKQNRGKIKSTFHLSFDDGLLGVVHLILPYLYEKGISASIYINPAFVDNKDMMFRYKVSLLINELKRNDVFSKSQAKKLLAFEYQDLSLINKIAEKINFSFSAYLKTNPIYASLSELQYWAEKGFHIGAHSMTHPLFYKISKEEQKTQIGESISYVEQHFKQNIRTFAYPFTDYKLSEQVIKSHQREHLLDLTFGCAGLQPKTPENHFQRIPMEQYLGSVEEILKMQYLKYYLKSWM